MRVRTWWLEHVVLALLECAVVQILDLPLDLKTLGWVVGSHGAQTLRSHAERKREGKGEPFDWVQAQGGWLVVLGVVLVSEGRQRWVALANLIGWLAYTAWRLYYRGAPPVSGSP